MKRRVFRMLALLLAAAMLLSAACVAEMEMDVIEVEELAEENPDEIEALVPEAAEEIILPAEADFDSALEDEHPDEDVFVEEIVDAEAAQATAAAAAQAIYYARVSTESGFAYSEAEGDEIVWGFQRGDVLLVIGQTGDRVRVAYCGDSAIAEGYMAATGVEALSAEEVSAYQAEAAAGAVALYQDDVNWPLKSNREVMASEAMKTNSASYNIVYYENCIYNVNKPFYPTKGPYKDSGKSLNWLYGKPYTVRSRCVVKNSYGNIWLPIVRDNGGYEDGPREIKYNFGGGAYRNCDGWIYGGENEYLEYSRPFEYFTDGKGYTYSLNIGGKYIYTGGLTINEGESYSVSGSVHTQYTLKSINLQLYKEGKNKPEKQSGDIIVTNKGIVTGYLERPLEYKLEDTGLKNSINFSELDPGTYEIRLEMEAYCDRGRKTVRGKTYSKKITVAKKPAKQSSISFNNVAYPSPYVVGTRGGYALTTGEVKSTCPLVSLKSEIVNANGQAISSYTRSISGTSYQIKNMDTYSSTDNGVKFSYIKTPGSYKWILTAKDSQGYTKTLTMPFSAVSSGSTSTSTTGTAYYYLDINGWIGGKETGNLENAGTVDVYINGKKVADDVTDYYVMWPAGTSYEIKDIRAKNGYKYDGLYSGSLSGRTGSGLTKAILRFSPKPANVAVTGVKLNKSSATLNAGQTLSLSATVSPSSATNKTVTWSSSNTKVATVSGNGVVKGVAKGTATITAKSNNGKTATCKVTVSVAPTKISLNKTKATMVVGATTRLTTKLTPSNANTTVAWSSSNRNIAFVDSNGIVAAVGKGTATITARTSNGKTATFQVTVPEAPTKIAFSKSSYSVKKGKKVTLSTVLTAKKAKTSLTWASSNAKIATVNSKGVVQGKKKGTVTITVRTANGKTASVKVTVK